MNIRQRKASDNAVLGALWERSVRATHFFLDDEHIKNLRKLVQDTYLLLPELEVWVYEDGYGIAGYIATGGHNVEMLFVDAHRRGQGVGRLLLDHVRSRHPTLSVDVNEQNLQGVHFYLHYGFVQTGRSPLDNEGNPFPILHMVLGSPSAEKE